MILNDVPKPKAEGRNPDLEMTEDDKKTASYNLLRTVVSASVAVLVLLFGCGLEVWTLYLAWNWFVSSMDPVQAFGMWVVFKIATYRPPVTKITLWQYALTFERNFLHTLTILVLILLVHFL